VPTSAGALSRSEGRAAVAEQELQAFSYIVSHDLAASLRHVTEFSRLLLDELGEGVSVRQRAHAKHIRAATDNCQAMMEQLLVFSRVQQQTLTLTRQDVTPTLRLGLLQLAAEIRTARAEVSIEPLGEVDVDLDLLAVAFRHLLANAIKFRRPDVRPRIVVQAVCDEAFWRLRITDNGLGVEPAYRDKAFRMFQRLNGEDAYPGVGAGLTLSRRIARRHGGDVTFLDCAEGACVELALPHAPTPLPC
jgi:light-regulated signal transduction histidine kinase (bacteriophytochrome)